MFFNFFQENFKVFKIKNARGYFMSRASYILPSYLIDYLQPQPPNPLRKPPPFLHTQQIRSKATGRQ